MFALRFSRGFEGSPLLALPKSIYQDSPPRSPRLTYPIFANFVHFNAGMFYSFQICLLRD